MVPLFEVVTSIGTFPRQGLFCLEGKIRRGVRLLEYVLFADLQEGAWTPRGIHAQTDQGQAVRLTPAESRILEARVP